MKGLELLGDLILLVAFIIDLFDYGIGILLAPVAAIVILILLTCGCKLK